MAFTKREVRIAGLSASRKRLLITGCGRSGTKYITFVMRRLGLDVRHERMGRDGIASWYMVIDSKDVPYGVARHGMRFENVFHQIRHPLAVIASATTFKPATWDFICKHTRILSDEPLILRSAKYWYYWNLEAEKISNWCYRIEDLGSVFPIFCERLQIEPKIEAIWRPAGDINTRKKGWPFHVYEELCERMRVEPNSLIERLLTAIGASDEARSLSWQELDTTHSEWSARIKAKALEYGYTT